MEARAMTARLSKLHYQSVAWKTYCTLENLFMTSIKRFFKITNDLNPNGVRTIPVARHNPGRAIRAASKLDYSECDSNQAATL